MKRTLLWGIGLTVLIAWISMGVGVFLDVDRQTWVIWVTGVAIITEVSIWLVAAILGVAVFQARKKVWRWLTRPFRQSV